MTKKIFPLLLGIGGLIVLIIYLLVALGIVTDINIFILALVFAIGPVAIIGMLSIAEQLSGEGKSLIVRAGLVFLIIGFAFFTLMLVVQQTIFLQFAQFRADQAGGAPAEFLDQAFKAVNLVQLGMDVAFDIFYCLGMVFFSMAMYRNPNFGRFLGIFGILSGGGLLFLNLATFPYVPAESGLVDLGPVTAIWWILVIAKMLRSKRRAALKKTGNVQKTVSE